MTITITPGTRDEKKIAKIKEARQRLTAEEWKEYCYRIVSEGDEGFDALYYAANETDRDLILEDWCGFLWDIFFDDAREDYAANMGGYEC